MTDRYITFHVKGWKSVLNGTIFIDAIADACPSIFYDTLKWKFSTIEKPVSNLVPRGLPEASKFGQNANP